MYQLLVKEIQVFFSSLIGYLVLLVFLTLSSLFLWVFPGEYNILDQSYASLDNYFILSPWVFLFLIPAITMRLFSEETKSGTYELLATKPLSERQIVLAKFFSSVFVVFLATIPSILYFFTIYNLGQEVGNLDVGSTIGAFLGLFLLASSYVSVGLFCSCLTDNQLVSFILAVCLCFFLYIGFDSISGLFNSVTAGIIEQFGINYHYLSLSRGLIDMRDLLYFLCFNICFLSATMLKLQSRKW